MDSFLDMKVCSKDAYQLGGIVDDDEVSPGIPEAEVSLVIDSKQLTHTREREDIPTSRCFCAHLQVDTGMCSLISRNMFSYSAMTVVTGLTTVYCRTPSLHLNRRTLGMGNHIIVIQFLPNSFTRQIYLNEHGIYTNLI